MKKWRRHLHQIIFEADTFWGKTFDVGLMIIILLSITVVMLESVREIEAQYGPILRVLEWIFTALFTLEYILRIITVHQPLRYALSFFGIVDFFAIVPTYIGIFFPGSQSLLVVRTLRLLRVFRVLKLAAMLGEAQRLWQALRGGSRKIAVFLITVLTIVILVGTFMYLIEEGKNGFTSIPRSIYWAITTLTTVGYGDIVPTTALGQFFAATVMILSYSILVVPTGIVSAQLMRKQDKPITVRTCPECLTEGHDEDAVHCKYCGAKMEEESA